MSWLSAIELLAGCLAVAGVLLNNHRLRSCFVVWLVSNTICVGLHAHAAMWWLAARDVIFAVLAVHGWVLWSKKVETRT